MFVFNHEIKIFGWTLLFSVSIPYSKFWVLSICRFISKTETYQVRIHKSIPGQNRRTKEWQEWKLIFFQLLIFGKYLLSIRMISQHISPCLNIITRVDVVTITKFLSTSRFKQCSFTLLNKSGRIKHNYWTLFIQVNLVWIQKCLLKYYQKVKEIESCDRVYTYNYNNNIQNRCSLWKITLNVKLFCFQYLVFPWIE